MDRASRGNRVAAIAISVMLGGSVLSAATMPSAAAAPEEGQPGYTSCWVSELSRTDVNLIDPFDMRTWPVFVTPSQGQPGYTPHSGASSEGSDIWTEVERNDPRVTAGGANGVYWDTISPQCYPSFPSASYAATAEILSVDGEVLAATGAEGFSAPSVKGPAQASSTPGDPITVRSTFTITQPALTSIIDLDGTETTDWYQGENSFRVGAPVVNQSWEGDLAAPDDVMATCDSTGTTYGPGDTLTVTCITTAFVPKITFDEYQRATFESFGNGITVPLSTKLEFQGRYVDGDPSLSGAWSSARLMQAGFTSFIVSPAQEWLPTALNKNFRVQAFDTLTVTPDGLLTGAEWSQGSVGALETYITNVPPGGAITPEGNLEFRSEQIGEFNFDYYLQVPQTEIRSQAAIGAIEVYENGAPPTVDPPEVIPPATQPPTAPPLVVAPPATAIPGPAAFTG